MAEKLKTTSETPVIMYQTEDGKTKVEVSFDGDTVWLTQKKLAELFERDRTVIGKHLKNIFEDGELDEEVVSALFAHTTPHGAIEGKKRRMTATEAQTK